MTMEKANVTINRLLSEGRLHELCCIVVDEAHMVSDPHRQVGTASVWATCMI
jgi:replicative superfamily II helicase